MSEDSTLPTPSDEPGEILPASSEEPLPTTISAEDVEKLFRMKAEYELVKTQIQLLEEQLKVMHFEIEKNMNDARTKAKMRDVLAAEYNAFAKSFEQKYKLGKYGPPGSTFSKNGTISRPKEEK